MKYNQKELCLLWLDSFIGLEYKHKAELYKRLNNKTSIKEFIKENKGYITEFIGENNYNTLYSSANQSYLDYVLESLNKNEVKAVTIDSKGYPNRLKETDIPPLVLYAKGNTDLLNSDSFAIVGSRKSLPISIKLAQEYAEKLTEAGLTLVTGIAEGIDSEVIKAGLKSGKIISVVAGGFNQLYPKTNQALFERVCKEGLVVSEHPLDVHPQPYFFPVRNRIIAGLAKGTLIVNGAKKSGTAYTGEFTEEYGRDLFCIPYNVGVKSGEGNNEFIKRGAKLTDTPNDILEYYNLSVKEEVNDFTDLEKSIIKVLAEGETHLEKIALSVNKKPFEIISTLSLLEIKKVIVKSGVNVFSLIKADVEE